MKNRLGLLSLAVTALTVAGCQMSATPEQLYRQGKPYHVEFHKFNTTYGERQNDLTNCEIEAARRVPQNMQIRTTPRYTTPTSTSCYNYGYTTSCSTTGGQTYGGHSYSVDANAELRQRATYQCMGRKGYRSHDIPPCPSSVTPDQLKPLSGEDAATGRQGQLTTRSCYIATKDVQIVGNL